MTPRVRRAVIIAGVLSTALGALCITLLELRLRSGRPTYTDIGGGILLLFSYYVLVPLGVLAILVGTISLLRSRRRPGGTVS